MATVPHVTSGSGLRKFQADGFLLDRVYKELKGSVRIQTDRCILFAVLSWRVRGYLWEQLYKKVYSCLCNENKLFWNMTCRLVNRHRRLKGPCCRHPLPLLGLLILKTVSACSIEMTVRVFANSPGVTTRKICILTLREWGEWLLTFGLTSFRLLWKDYSNARIWYSLRRRLQHNIPKSQGSGVPG